MHVHGPRACAKCDLSTSSAHRGGTDYLLLPPVSEGLALSTGIPHGLVRDPIINPRCACAPRVTVVGSVCLSVQSHLTYGASVRPENAVTYSAGNEGQKVCGVFSETDALQRSSTPSVVRPCVQSAIFPAESTHAHYSIYHVVDRSGHFQIDFSQSVCCTPRAEKTVVSFVSCH